jgi:hypothetical protein
MHRWGRAAVATAALVVAATLTTTSTTNIAHATPPEPPAEQTTSAFCTGVSTTNPFTDVSSTNTHEANIRCLAASGITRGKTATTYQPAGDVTREQMASFIARLIDLANAKERSQLKELPAYDNSPDFDDVPQSSTHYTSIMRISQAGITQGRGPRRFEPQGKVTRAEMAAFVNRTVGFLTGTKYTSTDDYFTDDETSTHEADINGVASEGIAIGDGQDTFGPNLLTRRDQMAAFIVRGLAVLHEDQLINDLGSAVTVTVNPSTIAAGGPITGTITGTAVQSATVSGCGLTNEPVEDTNTSTAGIQFTETMPASQASGQCTLTFTVTRTSGGPATVTVQVTVAGVAEAADGNINGTGANAQAANTNEGVQVTTTDKAGDKFSACEITAVTNPPTEDTTDSTKCASYEYDNTDTFVVDGDNANLAAFEEALSPFDDVTGVYSRTGNSTFSLKNEAPTGPEAVTATPTATKVTLTIDDSATTSVDAYNIYRADPNLLLGCQEELITFTKVGTALDATPTQDSGNTVFEDTTVAADDTYCYRVNAVDDGDESTAGVSRAVDPPAA